MSSSVETLLRRLATGSKAWPREQVLKMKVDKRREIRIRRNHVCCRYQPQQQQNVCSLLLQ